MYSVLTNFKWGRWSMEPLHVYVHAILIEVIGLQDINGMD